MRFISFSNLLFRSGTSLASKVLLFLLFFSVIFNFGGYGQEFYRSNIIPPSPEASSLGRFTEIPVSYYTGLPNISFPLHEVKSGSLSLPISLSYHSSGIKVEDIANWTGIGWTLNAGGVVTRVIQGYADERHAENLYVEFLGLNNEGLNLEFINDATNNSLARLGSLKDIGNGCFDTQPDKFYINVNGINASFMFDWNGEILIKSNKKIIIDVIWENGFNSKILGWDITDDMGVVYRFRATEFTTSNSFNTVCYLSQPLNQITSWYLTEIRDLNNQNQIFIDYEDYTMDYSILNAESILHTSGNSPWGNCPGNISGSLNSGFDNLTVYGKRVSQIRTSNFYQKVEFKAGSLRSDVQGINNRSLNEIWIYEDGELFRKIRFNYDYSTNRLTLNGFQEFHDDESVPLHSFIYHGALPSRDSKMQDHWGYFNNKSNTNLIPPAIVYGQQRGGADREPNEQAAKAGSLKSIIYPTGGRVDFDFELNEYSFIGSMNVLNQNLFKQNLVNFDAVSIGSNCIGTIGATPNVRETNFNVIRFNQGVHIPIEVNLNFQLYNDPYLGAGQEPKAYIMDSNNNILYSFGINDPSFSTVSLFPGSYKLRTEATWEDCEGAKDIASITISFQNDNLNEPIVKKLGGGLRIKNIKHYDFNEELILEKNFIYEISEGVSSGVIYNEPIYTYSYESIVSQPSSPWTDFTCNHQIRLSRNPAVLGQTQGNFVGYRKVVIKDNSSNENGRTELFYTSPFSNPHQISYSPPFEPTPDYSFETGNLIEKLIFDDKNILIQNEVNEYESFVVSNVGVKIQYKGGTHLTEDHFYRKPYEVVMGRSILKGTVIRNFKDGQTFETETIYEYDDELQNLVRKTVLGNLKKHIEYYFYSHNFSLPLPVVTSLNNRNFKGVPLEVVNVIEENDVQKVVGATYKKYIDSNGHLYESEILDLNLSNPISDFKWSVNSNNGEIDERYETRMKFLKYHPETGNLITYTDKGGFPFSILWGYQNYLPIAVVYDATDLEVYHNSFENASGTIGDAPTGRKYFSGNTFQIPVGQRPIGQDLVMTYWYFDGSWKFQDEIEYNPNISKPGASRIDEIRIYPKRAKMTTYTYRPGVGMTSQADANNVITYFDFDLLGRLKRVKDKDKNLLKEHEYHYLGQ